MKKSSPGKTVDMVLSQKYLNARDLMIINPYMSYPRALELIDEVRQEMQGHYLVPKGRVKVALTSEVRRKCGF